MHFRRAISEELSVGSKDDTEASFPRVRSHLPPAPRRCEATRRGSASQHVVQTFHLLHRRVQSYRQEGVDAVAGPD